jgi:DNA-binding transcriptional LysR family regulator
LQFRNAELQDTAMDWDDYRLVLAVAEGGSLVAAARRLGVVQSTAFRRLNALEKRLGGRLFERLAGGYAPSAGGRRVIAAAERMREAADEAARAVTGLDARLSGTVRVTAADSVGHALLVAPVARFLAANPALSVEVTIENRILALTRREADVALRTQRVAEPELIGRKLAGIAWTVYAARAHAARLGAPRSPAEFAHHPLIGWDEATASAPALVWLERAAGGKPPVYRANSIVNQLRAAEAGIGLALLPCFLGDLSPALARVLPPPAELTRELWIATHRDLRRTARVRAFMAFVGAAIQRERPLLEGRKAG